MIVCPPESSTNQYALGAEDANMPSEQQVERSIEETGKVLMPADKVIFHERGHMVKLMFSFRRQQTQGLLRCRRNINRARQPPHLTRCRSTGKSTGIDLKII